MLSLKKSALTNIKRKVHLVTEDKTNYWSQIIKDENEAATKEAGERFL